VLRVVCALLLRARDFKVFGGAQQCVSQGLTH